jgi:acetyl-CoA carboxylase biotin carboxyl carrier protein
MSDREAVQAMSRAAAELVPALTERLKRLGLGEIEVRHGDLRVRVAAGDPPTRSTPVEASVTRHGAPTPTPPHVAAATPDPAGLAAVTSPAVGHFVYVDGLGPGLSVTAGAELGHVEMLGVRHEVRAAGAGTVRHLVAESGEPVEYGQVLVEVDPA